MSKHVPDFSGVELGHLADENALLRASLAEARERLGELEQVADMDPLTGLANRRRFLAELDMVVRKAERHGTSASLLYIDLTSVKAVNERHGRMAGDAALIHVARLLSGLIRSTDLLARIGDDRLSLLLDHLDHNSAIETGERLARCIASQPVDLGSSTVPVEALIAATAILPGDSAEDILQRADRNLDQARQDY